MVKTSLFFLLGDLPLPDESTGPHRAAGNGDEEEDDKDDVQSQCSSASSEDYIIILPECFDTTRPLGDSMYSSALSQPGLEKTGEPETAAEIPEGGSQPQISDALTTSQTLAAVPSTPATVDSLPQAQRYDQGQGQNGDAGVALESARFSAFQAGIVVRKFLSYAEVDVLKSCNFIEPVLGFVFWALCMFLTH